MSAVVGRALPPRRAHRATFRGAQGEILDEGLALYFEAPHSYTGEHVLELHGHGGPAVLSLLLARCLECGARLANPGEFTQRAFLNGKLDLAQAEGVADLIDAATSTAARAAARSLSGEFSRHVRALVDGLIDLRMLTEASLDFPEEDIEFLRAGDAGGRLQRMRSALAAILARAQQGALLREGVAVVLIGQPNVGKSSLMNRLAREEVAIVTDIAGTTRDALRTSIAIAGIPVTVIDTAGLRPTDDPIESIGIDRTWAAVAHANLALLIVDAQGLDAHAESANREILDRLPPRLPRIVVHNKIDLTTHSPSVDATGAATPASGPRWDVWLSAKTGAGVELLERTIREAAGAHEDLEDAFIARARHLEALRGGDTHLAAAQVHLDQPAPPLELFAEELREAQEALAAITGEFTADDLLGAIFSRFCIGK